MFDVGGGELILIILAILILFGPKKLPEFVKTIRKGINEMRNAQRQFTEQVNEISRETSKPISTFRETVNKEIKEESKTNIRDEHFNKN